MNVVIVSVLLRLLVANPLTAIIQSEYVPSLKESKVIVLFPEIAIVVLEEQEPPYEIVPASVDEKV